MAVFFTLPLLQLLSANIRNIIIIKRISRAPIYHTRWQHRALYNNTNHTHTHTHTASDEGIGRAVKNSVEIITKQVCLEGGFERGGRIRVEYPILNNKEAKGRR